MQSYLGSLEALNDPRNAVLKQTNCAAHSPKQRVKLKQKRDLESLQSERSEAGRKIEGINVNVSGKCYILPYQKLLKYPKSLLTDPKKRKKFYDFKKKEYFFDHNRTVAESINHFYQHGELIKPLNIPEQLFADELHFFGVYEYLNEEEKDRFLGVPPDHPDHLQQEQRYNLRRNIWMLLEKPETSTPSRAYNLFSLAVIIFSVFLLCIDSFEQGLSSYNSSKPNSSKQKLYRTSKDKKSWIFASEATCIAFFTLELMIRFIISWNKRQFLKNILNIIDLIAIIPFYITLLLDLSVIGTSLSVLRVLRLGKIFRVLKISRYTSSLKIIIQTLSSGHRDLWMLLFLMFVQSLFFASVTYYFEQIWAPSDTNFTSIPAALWWALTSSMTVGYGDMIPSSYGEYLKILVYTTIFQDSCREPKEMCIRSVQDEKESLAY